MMKKILFSFCFLISGITLAQSNLPACISPPFNNCYGQWTYPSGDNYLGEWLNNQKSGQGTYTFSSGNKYEGQWLNDKYNGLGSFTWTDGKKYVGQWLNNVRNGQATIIFPNGDKYVGQYKDDLFNGQGTYTWADGRKYVGQWSNDKKNGLGTFTLANGTISKEGIWNDDKFVQSQSLTPRIVPVVPKPPAITSNPQEIKRQKCIRLGLAPGSTDFQQCMN